MRNRLLYCHRETIYSIVKHLQKNHFDEGLAYLANHSVPQAKIRLILITQISFCTEAEILRTYHGATECCMKDSKRPSQTIGTSLDHMAVWLLVVVLEWLVLAPNQDLDMSIKQEVHERMCLFRSGHIENMFQQFRQIKSKSPREQSTHPPNVFRSAQIAMDNNNFRTASARLTSNLSLKIINDSNIQRYMNLHPPSLAL